MQLQKRLLAIAITSTGLAAAGTAIAAEQTGNLTVTTTISAACNAPSPGGNLVLPFDGAKTLNGGQDTATAVQVSVSCSGNPTIASVGFGAGLYTGVSSEETNIRYMKRTGSGSNDNTDVLGYKLYASKANDFAADGYGTVKNATDQNPGWMAESGDGAALTLGGTGTDSFFVSGEVFEDTRNAHASAGAVPGGTYNDTIVMTITY